MMKSKSLLVYTEYESGEVYPQSGLRGAAVVRLSDFYPGISSVLNVLSDAVERQEKEQKGVL